MHANSIFNVFLLDYDEGKVKYSPLYGRGSKVTILVGRHFQSGMFANGKSIQKKRSWDTFLLEIGDLTKSALFGGPTLPPSGAVL